MNNNKNIIHKNAWDAAKAVLMEKFVGLNAYVTKEGKSQINNLRFILRKGEKRSTVKPNQAEERKKKIKAKINATETEKQRKSIKQQQKNPNLGLEKINKLINLLQDLTNIKGVKIQISV